ncbi:class I SAM-dependent methyltransferase [Anabaena sphaerica FACHB-251]|uniref:Class I SAM-dependent methyltransferase n=1 Tax=Anabaena sphaerica FACHB-251 TaxID=2692883 RepID=A0A926WIQ9_9NOST|nr:class I SAM-dependent methyltransferase [Anabaena sphaerica]MBD2295329.1 class I SAM-dependent methyltransferase [Anabaena sphaerica FACHB-251]
MNNSNSDLWDKIRQQFDSAPYPRMPLDKSPKDNPNLLYIHNLSTAYYLRNKKFVDTKDKIILDAGCGTGYKSLFLAEANPGAKIVGVDISSESIQLAKQRLEYHGFNNAEFHVLSIYDLPELNYKFDYINCDELLYLFPNISIALQAMKSVLNTDGIIRSNLHSAIQRFNIYRAQKVFSMMGLMDENPGELEIEIAIDTMKALKDNVTLKTQTWSSEYEGEDKQERILMNYLFQGDKGYTISDMFTALRAADLEFISMIHWREWDLMRLFKEPDNLPTFLAMSLPEISLEERLQLVDLLHPIHRLLDFWCGHPQQEQTFVPIAEWNDLDWEQAIVHLHPQLNNSNFQADLIDCVTQCKPFHLGKHLLTAPEFQTLCVDSAVAVCLLPLLDAPQAMMYIVERFRQARPVDPVTLQPTALRQAFETVKDLLLTVEDCGYVMVEN